MSGEDAAIAAARAAAEGIRSLNHATISRRIPPGHVYRVLGQLTVMADRLPQALDQLESSVRKYGRAGELRRDGGASVAEAVAELEYSLSDARAAAQALCSDLGDAQRAISDAALESEDET